MNSNMIDTNEVITLRESMELLPQELCDMIYQVVFTAPPGVRNMTNGDGVATNLLQVSQASRAQYAQSYSGPGTDFVFADGNDKTGFCDDMLSWAHSLPTAHLDLIHRISLVGSVQTNFDFAFVIRHHRRYFTKVHMGHVVSKCVFLSYTVEDDDDDSYNRGYMHTHLAAPIGNFSVLNRTLKFHEWVKQMNAARTTQLPAASASDSTT